MKFKLIFIGGINRSGGSLLARLFDGHKNFISYPLDQGFPYSNEYFNINELVTGAPSSIPFHFKKKKLIQKNKHLFGSNKFRSLEVNNNKNLNTEEIFDLLSIPKKYEKPIHSWGKEKSDIVGVRKNYLEKGFYDNIKTDFNFKKYIKLFKKYNIAAKSIEDTFNAKHLAFFKSWDNGKHINNKTSHVIMQSSNGLYLNDINRFFKEFKGSRFIVPIKNILSYVASEKIRLARIFYGTRRYSQPQLPWYLIKIFNQYDLNSKIRSWLCAVTRLHLLQKEFGFNKNFLVYRHEELISNPVKFMKSISKNLNIEFDNILCRPTIGGHSWGGNSHYGKTDGISKNLENFKKVLNLSEIKIIKKATKGLSEEIDSMNSSFINLTKIKDNKFYELDFQKKYFSNKAKLSMYYSIVNSGGRRTLIKRASLLSLISLITSFTTYLFHLPRLIKLKILPGLGKQNYT